MPIPDIVRAGLRALGSLALEHAVISDGKEKRYEYGEHRENRMMKHPIQGRFKDTTTGELEPLTEGIKQIHARHSDVLKLLEALHPLRELSFVDTPLATDFKGGQFLSLQHPKHGSRGQLQHVSGLL